MVQVPEELQKFKIQIVCCGTQPNTHEWLIQKTIQKMKEKWKEESK